MFGKIITALVTPFDQNDNINLESLKRLIEHLIHNSTSAIIAGSLTGEAPTLSDIEKIILFEKTLEYVNGRQAVLAGVGSNSTQETVDFIRTIEHLNLSGYLVVVPYFNKPDQEGLYVHFKKTAECTKKPILIYNIPSRTGVDLELGTVKKLAKINNIIGMAECGRDINKIRKIKAELPQFKVYAGNAEQLLEALKANADGILSPASHLFGPTINTIIQLMRMQEVRDASELFTIYQPKFKALLLKPNPVPIKAALNKLGFRVGGVRMPLVDMDEHLKLKLFSELGI